MQVKETQLVDLPAAGVRVVGTVPGSPLVLDHLFFACEHPDAHSVVGERAGSGLALDRPLQPGQPVTQSAAAGVASPGQLRRGFLYYLERERAHPYRPFLHYNAWYDICWGELKIREAQCLEVIDVFGRELIRSRGVPLASFVWDDGWDDPQTLWQPARANFPNGFTKVLAAARRNGSTLGFWLSPFGGYGKPAEAAKWAQRNADVLVDTHRVGGDPGKGEPYGWASWSPRRGILALRNPAAAPASLTLEVGEAFELPQGAARRYLLSNAWADGSAQPRIELQAGSLYTFRLEPLAVLVFEAHPRGGR
jgi:hypothetical protein